ncbi:hypothetical protein RYX36_030957 [Vicia faba]
MRAYDFVSQEICTAEDPEFETFYTENIILNEDHLWHPGRACAAAAGLEKGIDRDLEAVLSMTPLN